MRLIALGLSLLILTAPVAAEQTQPDLKLLAASYVAAQEAVYEQGAGPAQLDALMSFYAPDYTYYHPQVGAKVTGLDNIRRGAGSHLGELAKAEIKINGMLVNSDMVSISLQENFTVAATGERVERPRMTVLTFKQGKIVQRVDM